MQREIKDFLTACLYQSLTPISTKAKQPRPCLMPRHGTDRLTLKEEYSRSATANHKYVMRPCCDGHWHVGPSMPSFSGQDISSSSCDLQFQDAIIQKKLLPLLQEEAVYSTTSSLERDDAFSPVFIFSPPTMWNNHCALPAKCC